MPTAVETPPRILLTYAHEVVLRPGEGRDPRALFDWACSRFENNQIELDKDGNTHIMSPTGGETGYRNANIAAQLGAYTNSDKRGLAFDSSTGFILPDGTQRSPDVAWVSFENLKRLPSKQRKQYLKLVPEFVVEIKSPGDHWTELQSKMDEYVANGVQLGWLIDPEKKRIEIYRQGATPDLVTGVDNIQGEGPVSGFNLDLRSIWKGLDD